MITLLQKPTALLLTLVMLLTMLPTAALAEDGSAQCTPYCEILSDFANGQLRFKASDVVTVKDSMFIQQIGTQDLMDQIDRVTEIVKGMSAFEKIFTSLGFYESLRRIYPTDSSEQMFALLQQYAEEYTHENPGTSPENAQNEILCNALVIYAAQSMADESVDSALEMIHSSDSTQISNGLEGDDDDARLYALAQMTAIYGMVYAFAHSEESEGLDISYDNANNVWRARQTEEFLSYVDSDPGREALAAYICALNMIDLSMYEGNEAVKTLLIKGFGHTDLVNSLNDVFNGIDHTCAQCGTPLTECVSEIIPGQDGSCLQDYLSDGEVCALCGRVLKTQSRIPASFFPCKDEITRDCVCDTCGKPMATCGITQPDYAGTEKAFDFCSADLEALIRSNLITDRDAEILLKDLANSAAALYDHEGSGYENLITSKGFLDFFSSAVVGLQDSIYDDSNSDSLTNQIPDSFGTVLPDSLTEEQLKDLLESLNGGNTTPSITPSPLPLAVADESETLTTDAEDSAMASSHPSLDKKLDKLAKQALTDSGYSEDQITDEMLQKERKRITNNALILYGAMTAKDWSAEQTQAELKDLTMNEILENMQSSDDAVSAKAITQSGMMYMMYCAYVNSSMCSDPNAKNQTIDYTTVSIAVSANTEFRSYLADPLCKEALNGSLGAMRILYTITQLPAGSSPLFLYTDAVCELLVRGYDDQELINLFKTELDSYSHSCKVCGTPTGTHEFVNGVCTICKIKQFEPHGTNMTLGNALDLNFAIKKSDIVDPNSYALITRTYADPNMEPKTEKILLSECTLQMDGDEEIYLIPYNGVSAKEMGDTISIVVYNSAGVPVSIATEDSVIEYVLRTFFKDHVNDWHRAMFVAMLDYGTEAQKHFEHNKDKPANGKLTDEHKKYAPKDKDFSNKSKADKNYYIGTSLILENNIEMQMGFKNITPHMRAEVSYTNHYGDKIEYTVSGNDFVNYEDKAYAVIIDAIVVADARQLVTVSIYDGDTLITTATDSIESYVARQHEKSPLYRAILRFGDAAYDSFHPTSN